ncbi:oligosaccharide flippase family protein [Ekhidna sp.]|uniref:oligosaccharide flippase family protein n=1 Tax=Ekhidna sp. TaxID=2608089 RepID=UPI0032992F53
MGVVIKQSFWSTAIAYLGVLVGFVNTLYLRPEYFLLDEIGLFGIITANAMMISPFTTFGMSSSYIKFFPLFTEKDRNSTFTFQFLIVIAGCTLVMVIGYLLKDVIKQRYLESAPTYVNYLAITAIIIVVNSLFDMFFSYSRTTLKVLFPSFLRDVLLRIGAIVLVVGYALNWFSFEWAVKGLAINYTFILIALFGKLMIFDGFRFKFRFSLLSSDWKKRLFYFSTYSMLLAGSFAVMNNATYDFVTSMLGASANGIFVTCFFIGTIVEMPRRNMAKVISPILSTELENQNMQEVESLYKRSSITMSILGVLIFIGIVTNLQDLFLFIPKGSEFKAGLYVVILVCTAKLATMISSFPGEIINYSHLYRYNLIFQLGTAILLIFLNYFMIPIWGLEGAAFSYFLAIIIHIIVKIVYVKYHFKIHPFIKKHFTLLFISIAVFWLAYFFNLDLHPSIVIAIRSILTTIIFILLIYLFRISPDINKIIHFTFERFLKINLPK